MDEEILDVVDENDVVIGKVLRSQKKDNQHTRVINAFIKNSEGKLWIPIRNPHKKNFPLAMDMSVGGCVSSGETYEEAFFRESMEEINLDISKISYKLLGKLTPKDGVKRFQKVYEIEMDETPNYNREDFVKYYWLTPKEILERVEFGDKHKPDLPTLIKRFYFKNN